MRKRELLRALRHSPSSIALPCRAYCRSLVTSTGVKIHRLWNDNFWVDIVPSVRVWSLFLNMWQLVCDSTCCAVCRSICKPECGRIFGIHIRPSGATTSIRTRTSFFARLQPACSQDCEQAEYIAVCNSCLLWIPTTRNTQPFGRTSMQRKRAMWPTLRSSTAGSLSHIHVVL